MLTKLRRLSWRERILLPEVVLLLGLARLAILVLPFRWIARVFGPQHAETPAGAEPTSAPDVCLIGAMIHATSRYLPWACNCLVQAMAGKLMLARRRIPSTVYLGVGYNEKGDFAAHAWLRSGTIYVTGGPGHQHYTVLTSFAD